MSDGESLIEDKELSIGQVLYLVFILVCLYAIHWFSSQIPDPIIRGKAEFYLWMGGILGIGSFLISVVASAKGADFDVISWSKSWVGGYEPSSKIKLLYILGAVFLMLFVFLQVGNLPTSAIYASPKFQVIELGPTGSIILTGLAAIMEEFGIILPLLGILFFISYYISGSRALSLIIAIIGTGVLFGGAYHLLNYGVTNILATEKVILMGIVSATMAIIFKNGLVGMSIHAGNNMGLAFFSVIGISPILVVMGLLPYLLVFIGAVVGIWFVVRSREE